VDDKSLMAVGNQALGDVLDLHVPGMENVTKDDLHVPRVKIIQPISAEPGQSAGEYLNTSSGESVAEWTGLIINWAHGRVYWEKGNMDADRPLCASNNNVTPRSDVENPPSAQCATCPKRRWVKDDAGNNVQLCGDAYVFLMATWPDSGERFLFTLRRTAIKAAQDATGFMVKYRFSRALAFSTAFREDGKKRWYEPVVKIGPALSKDEQRYVSQIAGEFASIMADEGLKAMVERDDNGGGLGPQGEQQSIVADAFPDGAPF
jgi:hypothetical protein